MRKLRCAVGIKFVRCALQDTLLHLLQRRVSDPKKMNIFASVCFFAVALVVFAESALPETSRITAEERKTLIAEAITEAKKHGEEQFAARRASIQRAKTGELSSGEVVGRLFKKPTESARKQGEARLRLDDMVRRAERKLAEAERKAAGEQTPEEKAETLAKELFHKPGSMLTSDEIALMTQESECANIRIAPSVCSFRTWAYRTINGTCNNCYKPLLGASDTAFTRIVPAFYEDSIDSLRGDIQANTEDMFSLEPFAPPAPSARLISKNVIFRNDSREEDFTHILMQWGQFLDHDLDLSPELEAECEECDFTEICRPIRIPKDDTVFGSDIEEGEECRKCLRFARSLPACPTDPPGSFSPREQLNALTSFLDGSNVYGSTERVGNAVRLFENGLLREGPSLPGKKPSLPIDTEDIVACMNTQNCYLTGDVRANEQISLTIMHTLWFREHNRIARRLKQLNPFWNDERLYQESRKIVGALLQKITYVDYLPKVMGSFAFDELIGEYLGYDNLVDPGVPNSFATAAYRYGHSLVRPEFGRLDSNFRPLEKGPLKLVDAFFDPKQFNLSMGTDPIVRGWLVEKVQRADSNINKVLRTQLFERKDIGVMGTDLAALNIQRGRDHGLPPFAVFVNFCKREFPQLRFYGEYQSELDEIHFLQLHGSLNDVDPWIGGLAEKRLPGSFIGPTFACIFGITFNNVRNGDRFWYEAQGVFTRRQLRQIRRGSVSRVICDNSDEIDEIQRDAFRSDQSRINCNRIPSIDLTAWREEPCFVGVTATSIPGPLEVTIVNRPARSSAVSVSASTQNFAAVRDSERQCIPIACPTRRRGVVVFIEANDSVSIVGANDALQSDYEGIYLATWPRNVFTPQNGIFRPNDPPCESSDVSAITVTFGGVANSQEVNTIDLNERRKELFETDDEEDETDEDGNGDTDQLISRLEEALNDLAV